jgi:glyoxylase-like metal-dependent hydrolase (beta-lactamase superfamily II)
VRVIKLTLGIIDTNCYIVVCESRGKAAVIDPGDEAPKVLAALEEAEADLSLILLTHGHIDHAGALAGLARATGAPVYVHPEDRNMLYEQEGELAVLVPPGYEPPGMTEPLVEGEAIKVGNLSIDVLHTPGHTRGSCSFKLDEHLFSGDLIFAGSVGRTDLVGGDARTLMRSVIEKVMPLSGDTIIHPGHGPDTTLANEKADNPFLMVERLEWRG